MKRRIWPLALPALFAGLLMLASTASAQTATATPTAVPSSTPSGTPTSTGTPTATATASPAPMPTPVQAGAVGKGFLRLEESAQLGNCQAFPDVAGRTLYFAAGYSGAAQFIELYDQAAAPPTTPQIWPAGKASAAGNWSFDFRPGVYIKNGVLICNSVQANPTLYLPGAIDSLFSVAFY
jgi:hypothetical protein